MKYSKKVLSLLMAIVMIITNFCAFGVIEVAASKPGTEYSKKFLQNGGFEENIDSYTWSSNYTQPQKVVVPYWDTTAYNTTGANGKLEFFKDGALHFNQSITNKVVADGKVAAELNADEVSTIYQRILTVSGSTYTWGLDHRGRDTTDTMVLFIGPEQYADDGSPVDPSKPSKAGQDQFVKMTEWLKKQYGVTYPEKGCSQKYTVYSKPFAAKGAFQNESKNADENFSMTQTEDCNQEWNLWVISSSNNNTSAVEGEAVKGWSRYGTNCYDENDESYNDVIKGVNSKLKYDCTYTVPKGQTKTLFAFCSFTVNPNRYNSSTKAYQYDATYGNLLDDINFKLYQPITSSITPGGSGGVEGGKVTVSGDVESDKLFADVTEDGKVCKIYTAKSSADDKYKFVGAYITETANDGTESTRYVSICHHDLTGLTKEEIEAEHSSVGFVPYKHDENVTDDAKWDYYFILKVENPVHIHMIYTKAPYAIYDANGGLPYQYGPNNESGNDSVAFGDGYYTGSPETESYYKNSYYKFDENDQHHTIKEKGYYYSHTAYDNPNWKKNSFNVGAKFVGWSVLGTDNNMYVFDANHKLEYMPIDTAGGSITIFNVSDADENGNLKENANAIELALDENDGVTLTAQWKFGYTAQAQTLTDSIANTYENTALGGWVEETFINDRSNVEDHKADINGNTRVERTDAYGSVGKKIIFRATPDATNNYVFEGWYKIKDGKYTLITTTPNLAITVEQGNSEAYYARFKTKTVPVVFHYSPTGSKDDYVYYEANADNKYGKYFQDVVYNETAVQPTGDTKSVNKWYTSPTERGKENEFDFDNTQITKETHLYASPSFAINYYTHFRFNEPWEVEYYATLKFDGEYIDVKNDTNLTDYNIYTLKTNVDENISLASSLKADARMSKVGKKINSSPLLFNETTNTGKTFNRCGIKFNNFYLYDMNHPVYVVFDFTYKGITYTSSVKNRSLDENITTYMKTENNKYYTDFPPETQAELRNAQTEMLNSIQDMNKAVHWDGKNKTKCPKGSSIVNFTFTNTENSNNPNFTVAKVAARYVEPWGYKFIFDFDLPEGISYLSELEDYGAIVLTDKSDTYNEAPTVQEIIDDSNTLVYSKKIDSSIINEEEYEDENGKKTKNLCVYSINDLRATDFDKNTYVVFYYKEKDSDYFYSEVKSCSYSNYTSTVNDDAIKAIYNYSQKLINYYKVKKSAGINN